MGTQPAPADSRQNLLFLPFPPATTARPRDDRPVLNGTNGLSPRIRGSGAPAKTGGHPYIASTRTSVSSLAADADEGVEEVGELGGRVGGEAGVDRAGLDDGGAGGGEPAEPLAERAPG